MRKQNLCENPRRHKKIGQMRGEYILCCLSPKADLLLGVAVLDVLADLLVHLVAVRHVLHYGSQPSIKMECFKTSSDSGPIDLKSLKSKHIVTYQNI